MFSLGAREVLFYGFDPRRGLALLHSLSGEFFAIAPGNGSEQLYSSSVARWLGADDYDAAVDDKSSRGLCRVTYRASFTSGFAEQIFTIVKDRTQIAWCLGVGAATKL